MAKMTEAQKKAAAKKTAAAAKKLGGLTGKAVKGIMSRQQRLEKMLRQQGG